MDLGRVGVWAFQLRSWGRGPEETAEAAAEIEALGYGAIWVPGGIDAGVFDDVRNLLGATSRIPVATAILSIWAMDAASAAREFRSIEDRHPGRLLLGLGVSHAPLVERDGTARYERPAAKMAAYLEDLEHADPAVPRERRVLAALGPRMLALAAARSRGAHPYFVPVEHAARAREALGKGVLLAPEQAVLLERDAATAREIARAHISVYLRLPNYVNNLRRLGFIEEDLSGGGSDRLVDAIVAWGDADAIARRVRAHHDAGADHVCVQVIAADQRPLPRQEWRTLAAALLGP